MTNLEYIRTLSAKELADWFYIFWEREQFKYNHSYLALIEYLNSERWEGDDNHENVGATCDG